MTLIVISADKVPQPSWRHRQKNIFSYFIFYIDGNPTAEAPYWHGLFELAGHVTYCLVHAYVMRTKLFRPWLWHEHLTGGVREFRENVYIPRLISRTWARYCVRGVEHFTMCSCARQNPFDAADPVSFQVQHTKFAELLSLGTNHLIFDPIYNFASFIIRNNCTCTKNEVQCHMLHKLCKLK